MCKQIASQEAIASYVSDTTVVPPGKCIGVWRSSKADWEVASLGRF